MFLCYLPIPSYCSYFERKENLLSYIHGPQKLFKGFALANVLLFSEFHGWCRCCNLPFRKRSLPLITVVDFPITTLALSLNMVARNLIAGNFDQLVDTALNEPSNCYQHNEFSVEEKESLRKSCRETTGRL